MFPLHLILSGNWGKKEAPTVGTDDAKRGLRGQLHKGDGNRKRIVAMIAFPSARVSQVLSF